MSLFGIPICISYEYYVTFLNTNFPTLVLSDDTIFTTYIIANIAYDLFIVVALCIFYKVIIWFKNEVLDL